MDIFYSEQLKLFPKLFSLIKMLLVLSHGQASMERGFSVNKEVEVENLMKQSVVAQRVVCEAVKSAGGVSEIKLVNELMTSCSLARQRYTAHLEKAKELKKSEEQKQKRKAILDEIDEIKAKKKRLSSDIEALNSSADNFAAKAEGVREYKLMSQRIDKSNALRKAAKGKEDEMKANKALHSLQILFYNSMY